MDLFKQDSTIPIYITLTYDKWKTIKLPVNPETLEKSIPSASETKNIVGTGEVSIPKTPNLSEITIESLFWNRLTNLFPPAMYVNWLEQWQKSKKEAFMTVTRFNFSQWVTCESFRHWINAGEEEDIYYELKLKEYRPYGAKKLNPTTKPSILSKVNNALEAVGEYAGYTVLVDIPRPSRASNKESVYNPYTTGSNETVSSVTKKITGSTDKWSELYNSNSKIIGEYVTDPLPENTKLTLPDNWVSNESYGIVSIE